VNGAAKFIPPIVGALLVAMVPHVLRLPVWVVAWCLGCWGYSLLAVKKGWPWPNQPTRLVLAVVGFLSAVFTFGHALSRDAGLGLLCVMAGLKPLEISSQRDATVTVFLTYFMVLTGLLYTNSLFMTLYMFLCVFLATAVLIHLNHPEGPLWGNVRVSGLIMLQALPLMIVLFFLFPRIQGSLWGFSGAAAGVVGFSDRLAPGSLSELVQSDDIAFRAEFDGKAPERRLLYWRGLVLCRFDGRGWTRGPVVPLLAGALQGEDAFAYTITLEPHEKRWLFGLDVPVSTSAGRIRDDHTVLARRPVTAKVGYRVESYTTYNTGPLKEWDQENLELPERSNPRASALASGWAQSNANAEKVVGAALALFEKGGFTYTLRPPLLGGHVIDDFLFRTRKGYCEHYASAFAFLMRAAGIPARIVLGYLGGEWNPLGGYLIVQQSDAHAWVEIWLPARGWVRVDPTSAVAPERVEHGARAALPADELPLFLSLPYLDPVYKIYKRLRFGWDALNNHYFRWFTGYSHVQQKRLLSLFGMRAESWKAAAKAFAFALGSVGFLAIGFTLWLFRKKQGKNEDAVQRTYGVFCAKLRRIGLARRPEQGPLDYARMVAVARQDLKAQSRRITDLYIGLRYDRGPGQGSVKQFRHLVREFNPRPQHPLHRSTGDRNGGSD